MNYGILDLKRKYQKNMLIGFFTAGIFFVSVFALASNWSKEYEKIPVFVEKDPRLDTLIVYPPIPPKPIDIEDIRTGPPPDAPEIGQIVAVDDTLVKEAEEIPTQNQLMKWIPNEPQFDPIEYASEANIEKIVNALLAKQDTFVPYDEGPVIINKFQPVYPSLAKKAGLEGVVWLKAWIDPEGTVRDVSIVNSSEKDAGFEEAAIEAAYKTTWKPAIANGQPVALWITYKVEFILK